MKKRSKKGFTLIELIIVIVILALLALIAIPAYTAYREKAALSADQASAKIIYDAALMYSATNNVLLSTVTLDQAVTLLEGGLPESATKGTFALSGGVVTCGASVRYPQS